MWVYVPGLDCPCAPVEEGLAWPWASPSPDTVTSVMWKGKPLRWRSLRRAWKRVSWLRRLCGLSCEPSTAQRGVDEWISSTLGSPASPPPSPADAGPRPTTAGCGRGSSACFATFSPDGSFLKTSEGSYLPGLGPPSETYSGPWPTSGSMRSGKLYRRKRWVPPIDASDGGCWPTMTVSDQNTGSHNQERRTKPKSGGQRPLADAAMKWQTPTSTDATGRDYTYLSGDHTKPFLTLVGQAVTCPYSLPAPVTRAAGDTSSSERPGSPRRSARKRLNVWFVEHLMGWPPDWTSLAPTGCECWETVWSRWRERLRSLCFGSD